MAKGLTAKDYRWQKTDVRFTTSDRDIQRVYDRCLELTKANIQRFGARRIMQEGAKYHGAWLETQPMGGEMYAKRDMEVALNNILIFFELQRRDGRMPGMIVNDLPYGGVRVHYDWMQGDFFTVPALRLAAYLDDDREYLERLYRALKEFDEYLWSCRDSDGDGCLETWCMWDTGDDNNTRFLVNGVHAARMGAWNGEEPPTEYGNLPFASAEYMAYSYAHREALADISDRLGYDEGEMWRAKAEEVRRRFIEYLWDDEKCFAFDRIRTGEKIDSISLENIKCMYQGIFTQKMADDFIRLHLLDPDEFNTPLPLPNIAANDPLFCLSAERNNLGDKWEIVKQNMVGDAIDNSWSGPVEGLSVQRSIDALLRYGHGAEVAYLGKKWVRHLAKVNRYVQQYDPFDGTHANSDDGYGPTILAALEHLTMLYGVRVENRRPLFSSVIEDGESDYEQEIYGRSYRLTRGNGYAVAYVDGKEAFRFTQGVRVETDLDGVPERVYGIEEKSIPVTITVNGESYTGVIAPNEEMRIDKGLVSVKKTECAL